MRALIIAVAETPQGVSATLIARTTAAEVPRGRRRDGARARTIESGQEGKFNADQLPDRRWPVGLGSGGRHGMKDDRLIAVAP